MAITTPMRRILLPADPMTRAAMSDSGAALALVADRSLIA
jgi:hypothetical protein